MLNATTWKVVVRIDELETIEISEDGELISPATVVLDDLMP